MGTRRLLTLLAATAAAVSVLPAPAFAADTGGSDLVSVTGTLSTVVVDSAADGPEGAAVRRGPEQTVIDDMAVVGGKVVDLPDGLVGKAAGGGRVRLTVHGPAGAGGATRTGDAQVAADLTAGSALVVSATTTAPPSSPMVPGQHSLTVLPVYWSAPDSQTRSSLATTAGAVGSYWTDQTGGTVTFAAPDVRDWAKIATPSSCDPSSLMNAALAANGLSAPTSRTQHLLVYFPHLSNCGWTGLGPMPGSTMWINGYSDPDAWEHETGHNLGLGHAGALSCTDSAGAPVSLSDACARDDYADLADVMGYAQFGDAGTLNAALADYLGLLDPIVGAPGQIITVPPISSVGSARALVVPLSDSELYVEYRPYAGRDRRQPQSWAGVQVRQRMTGSNQSAILAVEPSAGSGTQFGAAMAPDAVWRVPDSSLALLLLDTGSSGARVAVEDATSLAPAPTVTVAGPDQVRPGLPATLVARGSGNGSYRWNLDATHCTASRADRASFVLQCPTTQTTAVTATVRFTAPDGQVAQRTYRVTMGKPTDVRLTQAVTPATSRPYYRQRLRVTARLQRDGIPVRGWVMLWASHDGQSWKAVAGPVDTGPDGRLTATVRPRHATYFQLGTSVASGVGWVRPGNVFSHVTVRKRPVRAGLRVDSGGPGRRDLLHGRVFDRLTGAPLAGRRVVLLRRVVGSHYWVRVGVHVSGTAGRVLARVDPSRRTYYRWRALGTPHYRADRSVAALLR
ncbi:MAG: hypothetical protein QOE01_1488 [Actinomycetota bacterium]|nr:hypothetical protein [Actinomycetota bacterium]